MKSLEGEVSVGKKNAEALKRHIDTQGFPEIMVDDTVIWNARFAKEYREAEDKINNCKVKMKRRIAKEESEEEAKKEILCQTEDAKIQRAKLDKQLDKIVTVVQKLVDEMNVKSRKSMIPKELYCMWEK